MSKPHWPPQAGRVLGPPESVIVRDALGRLLWKVAETGPERGCDFAVVWVRWNDADRDDVSPWPLEDVWFADGQPVWRGRHAQVVDPQRTLTRAQYLLVGGTTHDE